MIGKQSRYASSILYVDGEVEFLGSRQPIDTTPREDDQYHEVVEANRVDLLVYRYLGNAELWWIICDFNNIAFPLELPIGTILRIPSIEHASMEILN